MAETVELPNFTDDRGVFEARRVSRPLSSDLVIYWSTNISAADLVARCSAFTHGPDILTHIEVIADDLVIKAGDVDELKRMLKGSSLVRFNVSNWTITWMGQTKTEAGEIQAIFGSLPNAMAEMVKKSINDRNPQEVEKFFDQLRLCLATTS